MHFTSTAVVLAGGAAGLATLRSTQVLCGVEFLFTIGERERGAAVAAGDLLISHTEEKEGNKSHRLPSLSFAGDCR